MKKDLHQGLSERLDISEAMSRGWFVIDVRAPIEFAEGSIPGSVNLPLLNDEERHIIGILYKDQGQQKAIEQGYAFLEQKVGQISQELKHYASQGKVAIICARGGMRSLVMTRFANSLGLSVRQIQGGFKAYRNWVLHYLDNLEISHPIIILGRTGIGKTLLLKELPNHIDLEGLAQHRGSLFGGLGLRPNSQKNFEALLVERFTHLDFSQPLFIEGESRKVGPVSLPPKLWQIMQVAPMIQVDAPLNIRVQRTIDEYVTAQQPHLARLRSMVEKLKEHFGKAGLAELLTFFDQGDYAACFERILTQYYDPKYDHGVDFGRVFAQVDCADLKSAAQEILTLTQSRLRQTQ